MKPSMISLKTEEDDQRGSVRPLKNNYTRIKRTGIIALYVAGWLYACPAFSQLSWPAVNAVTRPWTRWWWMGSAVDRRDLTLNMEKYRAAGLGGLELTPIYGVKGYEEKFIDYLSPAWVEMLRYTLGEARRLGLGLDMSTGTGWPFGGGPLIDSSYACKEFFYKTWTVKDGEGLAEPVQYIQEPLVHTDGYPKPGIADLKEPVYANKNLQALALDQVRFGGPLALQTLMAFSAGGEVVDLTAKVGRDGKLEWTAPKKGKGAAASGDGQGTGTGNGDWTLYAIFQGAHGKMVERAAPGAEGNVIDHFSARALAKYLSRFDTAFLGHDLSGLRCFFNDSYEVDDARGQSNWTPGFFELFRQHRGYDLRLHLPALFGKDSQAMNDRILCDYRETISDLLLEQFTLPWKQWAKGQHAAIRNQAHGAPANILDLYAVSDIPETEGGDILRYKFATSAAHVTGKPLASSESVTWLNEHFLSNLGDVRKAVDLFLLGGVNHVFYHGTAYSPANDPWPGWLFYASVHFTPNDPSWQHFSTLNEYITRCQSFLQKGEPDNDVLLYYPLYDSWSGRGRELLKHYDRMEPEFTGTGFADCAGRLQSGGYAFDYISDRQLLQTGVGENGTEAAGAASAAGAVRTSGGAIYRTVLLPDCRHISGEAMEKLVRLAESGATILVYKSLPTDVPGWDRWEERRRALLQLSSGLHFMPTDQPGIQRAVVGKGAWVLGDDLSKLLRYGGIRREPMVDDSLSFVRRKYLDGDVYFIVNHSDRKWDGPVSLSVSFRSAAIFDPMTGRDGLAAVSGGDQGKVYLQLEPGASCLVQTSGKVLQGTVYPYYKAAGSPTVINGKWTVHFVEGGPRLPAPVTVSELGTWTALGGEDVKVFSGTAKYAISFKRPSGSAAAWLLDLGKVNETAQVYLNGYKLVTLIEPRYEVVIPGTQIGPTNVLEVRVSNGMVNRIEDMDRQGIVWKKFYNTNFPAHERENRGANGLFDAGKWAPHDSGLSGPVTITPLQAVDVRGASSSK